MILAISNLICTLEIIAALFKVMMNKTFSTMHHQALAASGNKTSEFRT